MSTFWGGVGDGMHQNDTYIYLNQKCSQIKLKCGHKKCSQIKLKQGHHKCSQIKLKHGHQKYNA